MPATPPSKDNWTPRPGDFPSARALRAEPALRALAHNPAFRLICARRRPGGAWRDFALAAASVLTVAAAPVVWVWAISQNSTEIALSFGYWFAGCVALYGFWLDHGGHAAMLTRRSPWARPLETGPLQDLRMAGYPARGIAIGIWGAMASRSRVARLAAEAWAVWILSWMAILILPWRITVTELLALGAATYHLIVLWMMPRAALPAAALVGQARESQLKPSRRDKNREYLGPFPSLEGIRFALFAGFVSVIGIAYFDSARDLVDSVRAGSDSLWPVARQPILNGGMALAIGAALALARMIWLRAMAGSYLNELAATIEEIRRRALDEPESAPPGRGHWRISPRFEPSSAAQPPDERKPSRREP